jgi:hypothetical protein
MKPVALYMEYWSSHFKPPTMRDPPKRRRFIVMCSLFPFDAGMEPHHGIPSWMCTAHCSQGHAQIAHKSGLRVLLASPMIKIGIKSDFRGRVGQVCCVIGPLIGQPR